MPETIRDFPAGSYRFIPAVFQYSSGAAADPGFEIERVRFDRMPSLAEGFAQIAKYIEAAGRPLTSFCACELRSPAAFTEDGFRRFNEHYVKTLAEWKIFDGTTNPVARSNVCPKIDPPGEPCFHAFSFAVPARHAPPSFVIAGSGESVEGKANFPPRLRPRDHPDHPAVGRRRSRAHRGARRNALLPGQAVRAGRGPGAVRPRLDRADAAGARGRPSGLSRPSRPRGSPPARRRSDSRRRAQALPSS